MDNSILEPLKIYNGVLKNKHLENTTNYFDSLVKTANIDVESNRKTVKDYYQSVEKAKNFGGSEKRMQALKVFLIILGIVSLAVGAYFIYGLATQSMSVSLALGIVMSIFAVGLGILFLVLAFTKVSKKVKEYKQKKERLFEKAEKFKKDAWNQMAPLNNLYDWNIAGALVEATTPLFKMDKYFDVKKFTYLHDKYGFTDNNEATSSTVFVQSGSIIGNPFLIVNTYNQMMRSQTYTGSIVISWTEHVRDSNGRTRTVTRSQTLTASIQRPAPAYYYDTVLIYGNDAAPNLTFYRTPSEANGKDEKEIEKMVKKGEKAVEDYAEEAIKQGKTFTALGNSEFEVLFNALNRDNELEFRLLFTPLAQQNMVDLITSQKPFGDDFSFGKSKCLNYIKSAHSQGFNYHCSPDMFVNFDIDDARKNFIEYNTKYFEGLYFDLAPLISIPLYQQTKPREYIYKDVFKSNFTSYEYETFANGFSADYFRPNGCITNIILKSKFIKKDDDSDYVKITAHGFTGVERVEYVSQIGGDGYTHQIPVKWIEYIPVSKDSDMQVAPLNSNRLSFNVSRTTDDFKNYLAKINSNGILYERGLVSLLVKNQIPRDTLNSLNTILKEKGDKKNG